MRLSRLRPLALALLLGAFGAVSTVAAPASAREILHTVAKGQTLGRIAKRYNTTVDVLRDVNQLRPGERIHPGLVLVIPEKGQEKEAAKKAASMRDRGKGKGDAATQKGASAAKGAKAARGEPKVGPEKYTGRPKRPGFVRLVRGSERLDLQLISRKGKLVPAALPKLTGLLRSGTGAEKAVDPRLATLLGMVSDHFGGRPIHVVSGFRPYSPQQHTPNSNHNHGRAVDFRVEGVPNTVVRDYCRGFRNAGVGYYPNSSFVHLDVRSVKTYWVDYSRPGEAPRYDPSTPAHTADESAHDVVSGSTETLQPRREAVEVPGGNPDSPGLVRRNSSIPGPQIPGSPASPSTPTGPVRDEGRP